MTDKTQSSADIASRALEEAKARLSPEEFRLFVYCFNAQYIVVRMQTTDGFDPKVINLLIDGLVSPLMDRYMLDVGLIDKKDEFLSEARAVVLAAFAAAVVPQEPELSYPGVYGLIIDRAHAEGFEAPTLEQIDMNAKAAPEGKYLDFDALMAAERFHFQAALSRIRQGKNVAPEFFKPTE